MPAKLALNLTGELIINAGASMEVSKVHLQAHNIFIDIDGVLSASGRGYSSMKGDEPGRKSDVAASGAGHGGAGGSSTSQEYVGRAYGSFQIPLDFGSGGGQGYQDLVSYTDKLVCGLEQLKWYISLHV